MFLGAGIFQRNKNDLYATKAFSLAKQENPEIGKTLVRVGVTSALTYTTCHIIHIIHIKMFRFYN